MEGTTIVPTTLNPTQSFTQVDEEQAAPFCHQLITISKQEYIELRRQANYWEALHKQAQSKIKALEQDILNKEAKIKDLQNRLFGRKSEKDKTAKSEKNTINLKQSTRKRGQQPGSQGHGRTERPHLPVIDEKSDLKEEEKSCPTCGLPHNRNPALDEQSVVIEVEVRAHTRRIHRPAYTRNPGCTCEKSPAIITAPPPPRLIPGSHYGVSFWVEIILGKYLYSQPTNRYLQDLANQGLPISPGTVAGGLQRLAALFEPVQNALYDKQMTENLFHNDETRWEVFVEMEDKVGTRWYLWVTRSNSVVYYCIDPSRSAAVPGAHFAGLKSGKVIIICDRYSAYKKLARLSENILLAFCWAHVRRDFLDAGRCFSDLEEWALQWKEKIGHLYHLNHLRLNEWDSSLTLTEQSEHFMTPHNALKAALSLMLSEATDRVNPDDTKRVTNCNQDDIPTITLSKSAQTKQIKVLTSLLNHMSGLTLFLEQPEIPMDNNLGENSIRNPVTGRKNYYGSGSIWSAKLAAMLFATLQTLGLWGINQRCWLTFFLNACAENGGQTPENLDSFLPWQMNEERRVELSRPYPNQTLSKPPEPPSIHDSS